MTYLDMDALRALDPAAFQGRRPYPWANPAGLLTEEGFRHLRDTLPDVSRFNRVFGRQRKYGQQSHDRFNLEYEPGMELAPPWRDFIAELEGPAYRAVLSTLLARKRFSLRFHWHYTPNGCSVSPHCDSRDKLGSHIFYFNTAEDWDPSWGGETLILDDSGRHDPRSAPGFDAFDRTWPAEALGNRSLLFARRDRSWHGVREIACPPDALRKVFIVVIEEAGAAGWLLDRLPAIGAAARA